MSDSVVPTPSEKPKCGYELCDGPHKYMTIPGRLTQYADCPGPVIATEPETPTVRWHKAMDHLCRQIREFRPGNMMSLNLIIKANVREFERLTPEDVSTEPETPEATCEVHLEKDGRLRISAWVRPDQMYATLSALQSPASDPTPELRERILAALYVADYGDLLNWAADSVAGRKNMVRRLDAVLAALKAEPK